MTAFYDRQFGESATAEERETRATAAEAVARELLDAYAVDNPLIIPKVNLGDVADVCAALLYRSRQAGPLSSADPFFEQRILSTIGIHCTLQSVEGRKCVALAWRMLDPMEARAVAATLLKLADEADG